MRTPAHQRRAEAALARAGVAWERVRYARPEAGGEVAAYRLCPPDRASHTRIVAAHGAGNDALFPLLGLYLALARNGCEVFAFDLDGNGWESSTWFDPTTAPGAVAAAVRAAAAYAGALPTQLLGHSLGGALVLHMLAAPDCPREVVAGAVLSAPVRVEFGARATFTELLAVCGPTTLRHRTHYGWWGVLPAAGHFKRRDFPWRLREPEPGAFGYVAVIGKLLARLDLAAVAPRISRPVLLVYGAGDRLVPISQGEALDARIPNARFVRLPWATHWGAALAMRATAEVLAWVGAHSPERMPWPPR